MMISIVIPTRARIGMLVDVINNLYGKASNPDLVEIMCAFDSDDVESLAHLDELPDWPNIRWSVTKNDWDYRGLHDLVNEACTRCRGDLIGTWNDDPVMFTRGWDDILRAVADRHPWSVTQVDRFTQFPFMTRKVYDCLGHYALHHSIDDYLTFVARRAGIEYRAPISVYHVHASGDEVAEKRQLAVKYMTKTFHDKLTQTAIHYDAMRIKEAMNAEAAHNADAMQLRE